jgi:hypothetical protein
MLTPTELELLRRRAAARRVDLSDVSVELGFNPNQPRDGDGKWTRIGGLIGKIKGRQKYKAERAQWDSKMAADKKAIGRSPMSAPTTATGRRGEESRAKARQSRLDEYDKWRVANKQHLPRAERAHVERLEALGITKPGSAPKAAPKKAASGGRKRRA